MTARGDRKGLCLFDSDMPLRQRSERICATVTALGRSFAIDSLSSPNAQLAGLALDRSAPDVAFVVTRSHYSTRTPTFLSNGDMWS